MKTEVEIQAADVAARRRAVGLVLVAAVLAAAAVWLLQDRLNHALDPVAGPADLEAARRTVLGVGLVLGAGLIVTALWMVSVGRRIEAARRFPPPEMRVVHDTVVRRGREAVRRAYLLYVAATVLMVGGIAIPLQIWRVLEALGSS